MFGSIIPLGQFLNDASLEDTVFITPNIITHEGKTLNVLTVVNFAQAAYMCEDGKDIIFIELNDEANERYKKHIKYQQTLGRATNALRARVDQRLKEQHEDDAENNE